MTINPAFPSPLEMLCLCTPKSNKNLLPYSSPHHRLLKISLNLLKPVTTLFLPLIICSINHTESQSRKPNLPISFPSFISHVQPTFFIFPILYFPYNKVQTYVSGWIQWSPLVSHYSLKSELSLYCMLLKAQIYKYIFKETEKI